MNDKFYQKPFIFIYLPFLMNDKLNDKRGLK